MGRRWSALQKREVVLRLIRGEPLDALSKETQVPSLEIEQWKQRFLEAGRAGLRARSSSWESQELREAHETIHELRQRIIALERDHVLTNSGRPSNHESQHDHSTKKEGTPHG